MATTRNLLLAVFVPMATIIAFASQGASKNVETVPCPHPRTDFEAWQRFRSLPVEITEVDGNTVYWKFADRTGIHLGSFYIDSTTLFFDEKLHEQNRAYFDANLKSHFGVNYDSQCFVIYSATKIK